MFHYKAQNKNILIVTKLGQITLKLLKGGDYGSNYILKITKVQGKS